MLALLKKFQFHCMLQNEVCCSAVVQLATNDGSHHLHGGNKGWDKAIWKGRHFKHHEGDAVELTYTSKDGEEVRMRTAP